MSDSAPPEHTDSLWSRWYNPAVRIAVVGLAVVLLAFGWTLRGHFLGEDFAYVGRFYEYPLAKWPRLFVESWAGGMWQSYVPELRPVTALSFMVDARIWHGNAFGFRLTNLLLHAASAVMVGLLAWRAGGRDRRCGFAAAALFALHPVHVEGIQWITGRVDVLATALYLAGFLAFLRFREQGRRAWLVAFAFFCVAAIFSKEFGLTLPVMCLVADLTWLQCWRRWRDWKTWAPYVACFAMAVAYNSCRRAAFGVERGGLDFAIFTDGTFFTQLAQRQLMYLGFLFPPGERWLYEGAPLVTGAAWRTLGWIGASGLAGLAAWRWAWRKRPVDERRAGVFFGLSWYLVATLPLVVTYVSPRHLYLASAGLCVALAVILRGVLRRRVMYAVVILGLVALYTQRLTPKMRQWHDAAMVSGQISREVRQLERDGRASGALLLDVPELHVTELNRRGVYVWTWAVPFALRPPFTRERLDERMIVLESRGLYVDWERWHVQPAIAKLQTTTTGGSIIQLIDGKPLRQIAVAPERLRLAAEHFAGAELTKFPHESWRKFINELTRP